MNCYITKCDNLPKNILFVSLYRNNLVYINNLPQNLDKLDLGRNNISDNIIIKNNKNKS